MDLLHSLHPLVGELFRYSDQVFHFPTTTLFLCHALFQSFVSSTSRLSVFIRPSIVDVVVEIPVVVVAVETISVAMETWGYDYSESKFRAFGW